jgi:hypothetical protein
MVTSIAPVWLHRIRNRQRAESGGKPRPGNP